MAALRRQRDTGQSSDDEAAETEAFSAIPDNLQKPLGSYAFGMMGFRAVMKVGELGAAHCVAQHERGDSGMLRQASVDRGSGSNAETGWSAIRELLRPASSWSRMCKRQNQDAWIVRVAFF